MSLQAQLEALAIAAERMPDMERSRELLHSVKEGAPYDELFFSKLSDPSWLPLLVDQGFFNNIRAGEADSQGRTVYKPHQPLVPLSRLAASRPQAVTEILVGIKIPANPVVKDQLLRCMAAIKDRNCISRLCALAVQLSEQQNRSAGIFINELLKSWMRVGALAEALAVARAYLIATVGTENASRGADSWILREVNREIFETLTRYDPLEMAEVLFCSLRLRIKAESVGDKAPFREFAAAFDEQDVDDGNDLGYWLEDFRALPDGYRELDLTLSTRLFDAAKTLYSGGDRQKIAQLDSLLRSESSMLFSRLRWQLYADFPELSLQEARRDVLARIPRMNRADHGHNFEFAQLLHKHAKLHANDFLSAEEVGTMFDTVFSGPTDANGQLVDDDYREVFRRRQLFPIANLLRGKQLAAFETLTAQSSEIDLESYKPFRSGGGCFEIQHVAPEEAETLTSLSLPQMWSVMNEWQPKGDWTIHATGIQEDYDELAACFTHVVEKNPERFLPDQKWWENLKRPAALHKLLDRAASRIERKSDEPKGTMQPPTAADWANWFGIAAWITCQRPILGVSDAEPNAKVRSVDRDWTWSRIVVARFLQAAFSSQFPMPETYESKVAALARDLIETEDPRLESKHAGESNDWLTVAINSVRGRGIEALLELALNQKKRTGHVESWIFELISSRLQIREESPAVFALLGAKLRLLHYLFGTQLRGVLDRLFPAERHTQLAATVVAHFKYDGPMEAVLNSYPGLLKAGLEILEHTGLTQTEQNRRDWEDFGSQLGIHIAFYYWNGAFKTDAEGEATLDRFFDLAPKAMRARLVGTIGSIFQKQNEHTPKLAPRVMRIWERRFAAISQAVNSGGSSIAEYEGELAECTDWLRCESFPFDWRFEQAMKAIGFLQYSPRSHYLLESLTELGKEPDRLNQVLQILLALLGKPSDELRWSIQPKELTPLLSLGFASADANTRVLAERARDSLLRLGFFDFLEVGK